VQSGATLCPLNCQSLQSQPLTDLEFASHSQAPALKCCPSFRRARCGSGCSGSETRSACSWVRLEPAGAAAPQPAFVVVVLSSS
jgi:hypothetical protein